jgi:hypothetical protein
MACMKPYCNICGYLGVNVFLFYFMNSKGQCKPLTIVQEFRRDGVGVVWRLTDNIMVIYRNTNHIIMLADYFSGISSFEYLNTLSYHDIAFNKMSLNSEVFSSVFDNRNVGRV